MRSVGIARSSMVQLMGVVAPIGLSLALISRPIHGSDDLEPYLISKKTSLPELLLRISWFAGVPLLAIARQRSRGRRGIIAGLLGGSISYGSYSLLDEFCLLHHDSGRFDPSANILFFCVLGASHGLILGIASWALATVPNVVWRKVKRGDLHPPLDPP